MGTKEPVNLGDITTNGSSDRGVSKNIMAIGGVRR